MMKKLLVLSLLLILTLPMAYSSSAAEPANGEQLEKVVNRALEFLQRTQDKDGSWKAGNQKNTAVTALAVMAFLSAGHVPGEGPYGDNIEKGIRWVLGEQLENGMIATGGGHEMYHHGISSLMLAEVAGMTKGKLAEEVKRKLEKAIKVVLQGQRDSSTGIHRGGWRYKMSATDSDISVAGWQLMALRAAKNLGCDVPPESIDRAVDYVKRCHDPSTGGFFYYPGNRMSIACTGTGILALEICGKDRHHTPEALKAGAYLIKNPPTWGGPHFFYGVYYCSQAAFQLGDNPYWKSYQPKMHESLLPYQNSNGSWLGGGRDVSGTYGPNYCTAMAILALTVEYRFLPIYQRGEEPPENPGKADR